MSSKQKFVELIGHDKNYEFAGRMRLFLGISAVLVILSIAMLPINHFWRGHALNFSIDFRGGTEMEVIFSGPREAAEIRKAMDDGGFPGADVVSVRGGTANTYLLRFGAVSPVSKDKSVAIQAKLKEKLGADGVKKFDFSEGGDKVYLRLAKPAEPDDLVAIFKAGGVENTMAQRVGRPEENYYEVVLISLEGEIKRVLEGKLGAGTVQSIPAVGSISEKAGAELQSEGLKALLFTIICIMVYIAIRFDFRYGPGTVVALLHDAIVVVGTFAITYREFSLTTIAAILTVIGYSMNDTIVVFDRIRENAQRLRDKKFDRVVNISVNETLSRTIITSATVFFVTLAMNIWGTGVIRDFAFAMNVGVIVGTYSSIFVAAPILIWLNDRFFKQTAAGVKKTGK